MKKNFVLLTAFVFVFLLTNTSTGFGSSLPIIPGENENLYGMNITAGSGRHLGTPSTAVYKVTNLNDTGSGSLRYGLSSSVSSPKVIIFEVSGNIELQSEIHIGSGGSDALPDAENWGSYITIAGQTAPSPGITMKNYGLTIDRNCHDILIQHIRIRPGDTSLIALGCPDCAKSSISDPMTLAQSSSVIWRPPYNLVIDHCSFSWGGDMNFQSGADNATFMNCISSEALNSPLHLKGQHSKGFYLDMQANSQGNQYGCQYVAMINNLLAHNYGRNPRITHGKVFIANNVLYDFWEGMAIDDHTHGDAILATITGNYSIETNITWTGDGGYRLVCGYNSGTRYYVAPYGPYSGANPNYFKGSIQTDPWCKSGGGPDCVNNSSVWDDPITTDCAEVHIATSPPVWPSGYITMTATEAYNYVLQNAGARPADRDSVDIRIIKQTTVASTISAIIASQNDVGGWPNLAKNTRALTVPSNPNEIQPSGYTKLEEWLHGFLRTVEGKSSISPRTLTLQ